jgi:outer membrane scaffolding protein for murein synthesis (MipA/OmpV family)
MTAAGRRADRGRADTVRSVIALRKQWAGAFPGCTVGPEMLHAPAASAGPGRFAVDRLAGFLARLLGWVAMAGAQTPSPLNEWQYSAGVQLQRMLDPDLPVWQSYVGAAAAVQPLYDGARPYRLMGLPVVNVRYRDLAFLSTDEGVGVNLLRDANWRAGVAVTYDLGRDEDDYPSRLRGIGDIRPAPEAKLFAEYVLSPDVPLVLRANLRRALGGSDGWIGDLGAYLPLPGSSDRFVWFAGASLTFADSRYMERWFGVGEAQVARSGYRRYEASAGLKSVGFGANAVWVAGTHWLLGASLAVARLTGAAADSPLTERATNATVVLSVVYAF